MTNSTPIKSTMKSKFTTHLNTFRNRYDYGSQIDEFLVFLNDREKYFNNWLNHYHSISHPSDFSIENSAHAIRRRLTCQDLSTSGSRDQMMYDYSKSGCENIQDYMKIIVPDEVFKDVEQGHRMLGVTLSEWRKLSTAERIILTK